MTNPGIIRKSFIVAGQVQGVGFRPFVWRQAFEHGLSGFVRNTSHGVSIEVQGLAENIRSFAIRLREELPPLAKITSLSEKEICPLNDEEDFRILPSMGLSGQNVLASPDVAPCPDCLREIRDPNDPRFDYPFASCTNCGPRFSIIRSLPYDRATTTMACFRLCHLCSSQYANPADRRFHAQPVACPVCGPRLWLVARGEKTEPDKVNLRKPLEKSAEILLSGNILALKGLGGFQLACDATNAQAVEKLRSRKQRPHKALAVMAPDLASVCSFCNLGPEHAALLESPERPIVLCPVKKGQHILAPGIAPDSVHIGVMLPSTPLHALLFDKLNPLVPLVMTSANPSGEPLCLGNREAVKRLEHLADAWLLHDRDILARVDDSVVRAITINKDDSGKVFAPLILRRARGYVPRPVCLPSAGITVLGAGGELKTTFCLTRNNEAFTSQHIGDMKNPAVMDFYKSSLKHFEQLLEVSPQAVVHDLHPDFLTSHFAQDLAARKNIPVHALQHHAAHAASILAEHAILEPALVLCLDGTGLGTDGSIWGGELVWMDPGIAEWKRMGRLSLFKLPGGDVAARNPWRIARALQLQCCSTILPCGPEEERAVIDEMVHKNLNCLDSSSCGRLFDAVSALTGLCASITYEGQAAIRLESCAMKWLERHRIPEPWEIEIRYMSGLLEININELFFQVCKSIEEGKNTGETSARFHVSLASSFALLAASVAKEHGIKKIGLAGGVLQNELMASLLVRNLAKHGMEVLMPNELPPGDGGIALGQAFWGQRLHIAGKL